MVWVGLLHCIGTIITCYKFGLKEDLAQLNFLFPPSFCFRTLNYEYLILLINPIVCIYTGHAFTFLCVFFILYVNFIVTCLNL